MAGQLNELDKDKFAAVLKVLRANPMGLRANPMGLHANLMVLRANPCSLLSFILGSQGTKGHIDSTAHQGNGIVAGCWLLLLFFWRSE